MWITKFKLEEIKTLFHSDISGDGLFSISTDSRDIKENQIFLPLVGEKFDGHEYINEVFNKGCSFAFCEKDKLSKVKEQNQSKLIIVENTLNAYHKLANYYKNKINPVVVGITGSSGKTTTKELLSTVLLENFKVHKTEKNFNNEFGVPKTILEMPEDTEVLVLEMAMRGRNQISLLSKTAEPNVAVITNIGTAHIGVLGSVEEISKAKAEILDGVKNKKLILISDNKLLIDIVNNKIKSEEYEKINSDPNGVEYKDGKTKFKFLEEEYEVNVLGKIHAINSTVAIQIAKKLGMKEEDIKKGLLNFSLPQGRGNIVKLTENQFIIDESYNANPESLKAAIENLALYGKEYKKIVVIGELAELGEHKKDLMSEVNECIAKTLIDTVIEVGEQEFEVKIAKKASNIDMAYDILKGHISEDKKAIVLIKGSRVSGLDKLVKLLKENKGVKI